MTEVKYLAADPKPNRLIVMKLSKLAIWAAAMAILFSLEKISFAEDNLANPAPEIPTTAATPTTIPSKTQEVPPLPSGVDMRPYFGFLGGMDFASVEHNDPGTGHRNGFQLGADAELPIFVWLWFQPEIKYVQKGYSIASSPLGASVNATVPFNYLEVPLHAKVKLAQGTVAPFAILGPSFAVKLSGGKNDIGDGESSGTNLRTWDMSFDIGLGTDIQVSANSKLFVSFEYSAGLLTVIPGTSDGNRNIELIAGWNFAFAK
jgi:hypothetical protein